LIFFILIKLEFNQLSDGFIGVSIVCFSLEFSALRSDEFYFNPKKQLTFLGLY